MQHAFASGQKSRPGTAGSMRAAPQRGAAPHGMSNHRILQRTCAACAADKKAMDDETLLQRRTTEGGASGTPLVDAVLARPGAPLDAHVRDRMENRFNHDFGGVRIHDDALAHESARSVGAAAYTVGSGIVFGPGRYRPGTREGGHLLAHELAHTVQQGGLQRRAIDGALAVDPYPALEQEAERAADAAMSPDPVAMPRLSRMGSPMLSRAKEREWKATTLITSPEALGEELAQDELGNRIRAYRFALLTIPSEKGEGKEISDAWNARVSEKSLETIVSVAQAGRPPVALKEARFNVRRIWAQKYGLDEKAVEDAWGTKIPTTEGLEPFYVSETKRCEVDHIVEQQFGGTSIKENLRLLHEDNNGKAGDTIYKQIETLAIAIREKEKGKESGLEQVVLHFDAVDVKAGACDACCEIEKKIATMAKAGELVSSKPSATEGLAVYPISAGGSATSLYVTADPSQDILESSVAENRAAAGLIVGMRLQTLDRGSKKGVKDKITAGLDLRKGSRLPITTKDGDDSTKIALNRAADGQLSMPTKTPKIEFTYPYLSKGEFTKLKNTPQGLTGEGTIYPTIPFLGPLGVRFAPGELTVTKGLDQKALKPPFTGFRITKGELALELAPDFKPSGIISFAIGPENNPVAVGDVTAGLEGGNFAVKGTLTAQIPGLNTAVGTVTYIKDVGWDGRIELKTSKIPNTRDVSVVVTLGPDGFAAEGGLTIVLPGEGNTVALHVARKEGRFVLTGDSTLELPVKGMEPVTLSFEHDGVHIKGSGHTSISFHGLKGDVAVAYHDGKVSGKGEIDIKKPRAAGTLAVKLSEQNRISGEGAITYRITDDLVATAGIILGEDQSVRLKGALEIVKPIELFPAAKGKKTLLAVPTITIPIPGASIGPVGLVVKIDGGIEIHYQVGPGELRNTKVEAAFNPLDEKPDLDLLFGTQLHVGANAGIGGFVRGALAIDAVVASVSGGLTVGAQADLEGNAQADLKIHYTKSRFEFDAKGMIEAGLALGLTLDADVRAEAGIGPFTASWMKVWHLAAYKLDTGLRFGLEAPLHYDSDRPFKAPSVGDIKWTLPTLSPRMLLDKAMNSAAASETEK